MLELDAAPIAAIATAPGRGGIGVIRVSGKDLRGFVSLLLKRELVPRHAHYLPFVNESGAVIDQGIAIFFQAPHSYTGEDVLELQGHGGTAVMQRLLDCVLSTGKPVGMRLAQPGEFSLRAYFNDKIDLVQAEAIDDLIGACSQAAAEAAVESLKGSFSTEIYALSAALVELRTLVEATLDFPEEEIEFIEKYQVLPRLKVLMQDFDTLLSTTEQSQFLSVGLKITLVGEPNVGKSSLMNAIFGEDISIVTEMAGTTRDNVKENITLDGVPVTIVDTAGLRITDDTVEKIGIKRSLTAVEACDLILDVVDARQPKSVLKTFLSDTAATNKPVITVHNKIDLLTNDTDPRNGENSNNSTTNYFVSARDQIGLGTLKQAILDFTGRRLGDKSPWLARKRHVVAIKEAKHHLKLALECACHDNAILDLMAEELRLSHQQLGSITGNIDADELLGKIFSSFCIGK